jgi:hypothetical protein
VREGYFPGLRMDIIIASLQEEGCVFFRIRLYMVERRKAVTVGGT